ncbi:MAG: alpha-L-fucosidase [Cyclobacteriaceae bacterium]
MNSIKSGLWIALSILITAVSAQNTEKANLSDDELMGWFREAKFGMFIHFGAETPERLKDSDLSRTEKYEIAVREFNPVDFDAKEWVGIAKDAGMKYIVFTTKHHDGFCKWDSKHTEWDVIDQTPFKRDIVGELADACKEAGIELGFYYSIADWHEPSYDPAYSNRRGFHFNPNPDADITEYMGFMYAQIKELCENYQPKLFWFDGSAGFRNVNRKRLLGQQEMVDLLNSYGAICNSRYGDDDALEYVSYLSTGDNMSPTGNIRTDYETAMTMNNSWHFEAEDEHWKSADTMLEYLVKIVGTGGNYLLNVGPNRKGVIPEESQTRLKIMGEWLEKNGDAIYGTKAGPYPYELNWGSITQRNKGDKTMLYLNVVDWPKDGVFNLYGLSNKVVNASLLATGDVLTHEAEYNPATGTHIIAIQVPEKAPDPYVSVIALQVEGDPVMDQAFLQQQDGKVLLDAFYSTIHDNTFVPGKPLRPIDQRIFTVMKKGEGIMPARGMTVALGEEGQALSWDFRLVEPGSYKVVTVSNIGANQEWKTDGRMRVTVAGQSIENKLGEDERTENRWMAHNMKSVISTLGTVKINTPGMHTLTLEVAADFADSTPHIRYIQLWPVR